MLRAFTFPSDVALGERGVQVDRAFGGLAPHEHRARLHPSHPAHRVAAALDRHSFLDLYVEPNADVTDAARAALRGTETRSNGRS